MELSIDRVVVGASPTGCGSCLRRPSRNDVARPISGEPARRASSITGVAAIIACGSLMACSGRSAGVIPSTSEQDAAPSVEAGTSHYPAEHAALPRVETQGGPVLKNPTVVPVFFANDPLQPRIEQFLSQLADSSYWPTATSEYGVGPLQVAPSIVVTDQAPMSITSGQISSFIAGKLDGTHPEWPAIDDNNIYALFYPLDTTISEPFLGTSCTGFGAYHGEGSRSIDVSHGGMGADAAAEAAADDGGSDAASDVGGRVRVSFPFAIIPRCAIFNTFTGIDAVTAPLSHELVETATDPYLRTRPAYAHLDVDHVAWALGLDNTPSEEVADLCKSESADRDARRLVGDFMVERIWSNQAAAANQDPCVPAISDPYFGAAPEFDELDEVTIDGGSPSTLMTTGIKLAVGQSRTISVHLFSTGPIPSWYVSFRQLVVPAGAPTTLRAVLDKTSGNNGDVLELTITRTAAGPTDGGTVIFLASSQMPLTANTVPRPYTRWYGFVQN